VRYFSERCSTKHFRFTKHFPVLLILILSLALPALAQKPRLPKPLDLDRDIELVRDPATGELNVISKTNPVTEPQRGEAPRSGAIFQSSARLVMAGCSVTNSVGEPIHNLAMGDFDVAVDGAPQALAVFDAAKLPAHIVLVLDSSPSEFWSLDQSKKAARALAAELDPTDEIAVVAFAGHAHLLLPFTTDRAALEAVIDRVDLMRSEMEIGSNIYSALFLAAHELFSEAKNRVGPHAIVLLTDGQDSGLGLSWNPASMQPSPDSNQLAFEDVVRKLSVLDVEVFAISTENRPKGMTPAWLDAHSAATLISKISHRLNIPSYTIFLAELVRRTGGELDFLRDLGTLSDAYRRVATIIRAEYTLGSYSGASGVQPGWHNLKISFSDPVAHADARLHCRTSYYVPRTKSANVANPAHQSQ
jgi:VWFA-related protein